MQFSSVPMMFLGVSFQFLLEWELKEVVGFRDFVRMLSFIPAFAGVGVERNLRLSPGVRQTVKTLFAVRRNCACGGNCST